jgi:hypothetical protein
MIDILFKRDQWTEMKINTTVTLTILTAVLCVIPQAWAQEAAATQPAVPAINIRVETGANQESQTPIPPRVFTGRFTAKDLKPLLTQRSELLPLPFQFEASRQSMLEALDRVSMGALILKLVPSLQKDFPDRFDLSHDLLVMPVPPEKQVERKVPEIPGGIYRGPKDEVTGFLVHRVTEEEYLRLAIQVMQTALQLLDTGDPIADRTSPNYFGLIADQEIAERLKQAKNEQKDLLERKAIRRKVGEALGIYDCKRDVFEGEPEWGVESRRFAFVVKNGEFIDRLRGLVQEINNEIDTAGFTPPSGLYHAGIRYDLDLNEVMIVLPKPMLKAFLQDADNLERRMADDHMISIEAVRITDREIIDGALASRLNVDVQGVHNVQNMDDKWVRQQLGLNSLLAVANNEMSLANAGRFPAGTSSSAIGGVNIPPPLFSKQYTTVGGNFSVGADDMFFDGRQQSYGFSYIGADGVRHTLSMDVVDSMREYWDRIERNLIVHKIKKTGKPTVFSVPVGPQTKTFEGIAALISQENRELVISQEGSLVQLSATAGTWLVIQDFTIEPTPGSSTSLTSDELRLIEDRVLLTMFLRDTTMDVSRKCELVEAKNGEILHQKLRDLYELYQHRHIRSGQSARTYEAVYNHRRRETVDDSTVEKKEENSRINLSFYSSQGNINQQAGVTSLGDSNDLTSFTTELMPNVVTPISSYFTKSANGAKGSSPLSGKSKGESSYEEKNMAHLVVRARFPTVERERSDLQEGRYMGYFDLPLGKKPYSDVDLPFLSSSDHPLTRLSKYRFGLIFPSLQDERVRRPYSFSRPNTLAGDISARVWETATTRLLMNRMIITDSPGSEQDLEALYRQRFKIEVRSLLEYDEDFFAAPKIALRNMEHWNDPDRIVFALKNSANNFPLCRLMEMIDELGEKLVPREYADNYLGYSTRNFWGDHELRPLTEKQLQDLRRDVANHYLRLMEVYGDAFLEAVSILLDLNTYRGTEYEELTCGPFRGYRDLVIFDQSTLSDPDLAQSALEEFLLLKAGGYKGKLFESSLLTLEDMKKEHSRFVFRGTNIINRFCTKKEVPTYW